MGEKPNQSPRTPESDKPKKQNPFFVPVRAENQKKQKKRKRRFTFCHATRRYPMVFIRFRSYLVKFRKEKRRGNKSISLPALLVILSYSGRNLRYTQIITAPPQHALPLSGKVGLGSRRKEQRFIVALVSASSGRSWRWGIVPARSNRSRRLAGHRSWMHQRCRRRSCWRARCTSPGKSR